AFDAYASASKRDADILLLDTAGRLHTKSNLMEELSKIKRVLKKQDSELPHESWLVLDGSLGTNSIDQARAFHESFGLTGLIVTKLDGTSRGGALVGIYRELGLPIFYVGLGEKPEDLMDFDVDSYADAIFTESFAN
ncbi:MAG: signal recognition particle-docking protein FtsY, partial [Verrucomicrobiota bacterium]